jgi:hypothetical protein
MTRDVRSFNFNYGVRPSIGGSSRTLLLLLQSVGYSSHDKSCRAKLDIRVTEALVMPIKNLNVKLKQGSGFRFETGETGSGLRFLRFLGFE